MEFFAYFKARKARHGNHGVHSYPEILYNLREKYKKNLVDPTGGKEPLKYREYVEANAENLKKNAGYKLDYRKKKSLEINQFEKTKSDGYGFQIEMTYRSFISGLNIIEVPITFHERREGKSKMSRKIIFEALFVVIKLRFLRM